MDHVICINRNTFPVHDSIAGDINELFHDALQGVLSLNKGGDRFTVYHDSDGQTLRQMELACGYTYEDFLNTVRDSDNVDLYSVLLEFDDKSPALDHVPELMEELIQHDYYIPGQAMPEYRDILAMCYLLNGTLLSLPIQEHWAVNKVVLCRTEGGEFIRDEFLWVPNIATARHGLELLELRRTDRIETVCAGHTVSGPFLAWHSKQTLENQARIVDKLKLACARGFSGGEPLFKTLSNADGIRELRLRAYPGGAIRILFKHAGPKQIILNGFIKKRDDEGYVENVADAQALYAALT